MLSNGRKTDLTSGTWEEIFGNGLSTDEIFQAWQYALYANAVTAAGKKEYNIPMYVNTALNYKNVNPGQYPSAGPLPHLMDVWQAGAPEIDILSPDFYNPYFRYIFRFIYSEETTHSLFRRYSVGAQQCSQGFPGSRPL